MSRSDIKKLYNDILSISFENIEEYIRLAETDDEKEFFAMIEDYKLMKNQDKAIRGRKF